MRILGALLVAGGILALVFGGFHYDRQKTLIDMGPIHATATEEHRVPISPIVGGGAIVAGLLLLVTAKRSS